MQHQRFGKTVSQNFDSQKCVSHFWISSLQRSISFNELSFSLLNPEACCFNISISFLNFKFCFSNSLISFDASRDVGAFFLDVHW